jgi:hypothetical protein
MSKVFTQRGKCHVSIEMTDEGALRLSGQHLSGGSEYEYFISVRKADFGKINAALGQPADADIVASMCAHADEIFDRGERSWLEDQGVEVEFSSWGSFD